VEILKHFHYQKVIFLHSSDTDGRSVLGRFQTNAQNLEDDIEIKVETIMSYSADPFVPFACTSVLIIITMTCDFLNTD
jgi:hypothetical protein